MQRAVFHLPGLSGLKTGREVERFNVPSARRALFTVLVLLGLFCFTAPLRAEGPILTLAMVNYDSLISRTAQGTRDSFVPKAVAAASADQSDAGELLSLLVETITLPSTSFLQKLPEPEPSNPLLLSLRNVGEDGRLRVWASLTAGYGQVFLYKSVTIYGRHGSCWEEPGCGFLKFSFNF